MPGIEDDIEHVVERTGDFVERRGGGRKSLAASVIALLVFIAGTSGWDVLVPNDVKDQIHAALIEHEEEPCHGEACDRLDGLRSDLITLVGVVEQVSDNQKEFQIQQEETLLVVKSYAEANTISIEMIRGELDETKRRDQESELREERRDLEIERNNFEQEIQRIRGNGNEPPQFAYDRINQIELRLLEIEDELEML